MDAVTDALARAVTEAGVVVQAEAAVEAVESGFVVRLRGGCSLAADALLVALPAPAAATVLRSLDPALADPLAAIPMGTATAVIVGFASGGLRVPDSSGWLVPRREGGPVQAVTLLSRKHIGVARSGYELARVFLRAPFAATTDEVACLGAAVDHLRQHLGPVGAPVWSAVQRWTEAMPRYTLGHLDRLTALDAAAARHPGLAFAGASLRGVGLPDVIAGAERAADDILTTLPLPTR